MKINYKAIVLFVIGLVAGEINVGAEPAACQSNADCDWKTGDMSKVPHLIGARLAPPPCFRGKCQHPKGSQQWLEYCDHVGPNGDRRLWNCYRGAAQAALNKSFQSEPYTISWTDAFNICDRYIPEAAERCKLDVCSQLGMGDEFQKGVYPEKDQCDKDAYKKGSVLDI